MIDLIDVETHRLQCFGQALEKLARARQPLVVVARLVEVIAGIDHLQAAGDVALEQAELGLQAGIEGPATLAEAFDLLLQHIAAVIGPGFAIHMPDAHHPSIARLPWHRCQRRQVAPGHEVRPMRLHAHAANRETGKAGTVLCNHFQTCHRNRFGLGRTMNVDELSQYVLDAVLFDQTLCFGWQHGTCLLAKAKRFREGPLFTAFLDIFRVGKLLSL